MTPNPAQPHGVTLTVRERLVQIRAEKALGRAPAWLGAGKRWLALAAAGCACGCGCGSAPDQAAGRRVARADGVPSQTEAARSMKGVS